MNTSKCKYWDNNGPVLRCSAKRSSDTRLNEQDCQRCPVGEFECEHIVGSITARKVEGGGGMTVEEQGEIIVHCTKFNFDPKEEDCKACPYLSPWNAG